MLTLTRETKFDASHWLPDHDSKCSRQHGHTYLLQLSITGPVMPLEPHCAERGMVIEMEAIKNWLKLLTAELDHSVLNDRIEYPTTERVLLWIVNKAKDELEPVLPDGCWVSEMALYEQALTPKFWAKVVLPWRGHKLPQ